MSRVPSFLKMAIEGRLRLLSLSKNAHHPTLAGWQNVEQVGARRWVVLSQLNAGAGPWSENVEAFEVTVTRRGRVSVRICSAIYSYLMKEV